jgi:DNA invertase Pin-like site-specific DNA recombinase
MKKYGYLRVSSKTQHEDRQLIAMSELRIPPAQIFTDKFSGKDFDRPAWLALTQRLRPGDLLVVKSLDRLGRNYAEIIEWWRRITTTLGADILILDMPLLDTRQGRDLTGTLIADIILALLSYVADTELTFIRQRQAEGIAAARERGVQFGRREKTLPEDFDELHRRWRTGEFNAAELAVRCGVSRATLFKRLAVYQSRD